MLVGGGLEIGFVEVAIKKKESMFSRFCSIYE